MDESRNPGFDKRPKVETNIAIGRNSSFSSPEHSQSIAIFAAKSKDVRHVVSYEFCYRAEMIGARQETCELCAVFD